jgi:hypothetical protein
VCMLLCATWALRPDLRAQEASSDTAKVFKNAIHLGFSGVSSIASINYERVLLKKDKFSVSARIGFGSIHLKDFTRRFNPDLLVPLGLYGTYGRWLMAEVGAGGTYTSITYPDELTFEPSRRSNMHGWCSVGMRGRITDHLWLRAAFTPIFEFGRVTRAFELGIGYRF